MKSALLFERKKRLVTGGKKLPFYAEKCTILKLKSALLFEMNRLFFTEKCPFLKLKSACLFEKKKAFWGRIVFFLLTLKSALF